jgi:hypothetical protein
MNKKGWIKIVEASIAILILVGVSLFLYGGSSSKEKKDSSEMYRMQRTILEAIQNNDEIRSDVLKIDDKDLPIEWKGFDTQGLEDLKNLIESLTPSNIICISKICEMSGKICDIEYMEKDVYAYSAVISANQTTYSPKQVKLFCYKK